VKKNFLSHKKPHKNLFSLDDYNFRYGELTSKFSRDEHRHYLFSPRHLTQWCVGLMRYDLAHDDVLECWLAEAYRVFGDVMVGSDRDKFESVLWQV
jgi:dynein heavy chain 2